MSVGVSRLNNMPVVARAEQFDRRSGDLIERLIFNSRGLVILLSLLATLVLGWQATQLTVGANFNQMIPQSHPFIRNYFDNAKFLGGLGNAVRVVVENKQGDIYDADYLETLKQINDKIYLLPGVDRAFMKSLWMPAVRWTEVTDQGFVGGPVMPDDYNGSNASLELLKRNVARGNLGGTLVANNAHSSLLFVPLLERYADSGQVVDSAEFAKRLDVIRSFESDKIGVHVVGFPQLVGDLVAGLGKVMVFFVFAALIAMAIIFSYTRCARSTLLVTVCSIAAVAWQLGIFHLMGFDIDPYSILVPFLVFAIGISHGAQKMNGVMQDIGRGTHPYVAARYTFRRLFLAGLTALLADVVGFAVLVMIDIPMIQGLAIAASIGVGVLIFTNLILLPVLLSYTGVSRRAAERSLRAEHAPSRLEFLVGLTRPGPAKVMLAVALALVAAGYLASREMRIGDLDPGAPELRPDSRYNRDNAFINRNFGLSSDQFAVIVKTPEGKINNFASLLEMDRLEEGLRRLPGVQTTVSVGSLTRLFTAGNSENNPKWMSIPRDQLMTTNALSQIAVTYPDLVNDNYSVAPLIAYLADHKAETLERVVEHVQGFAAAHDTPERQFLLAAGSAGIEAATNDMVRQAHYRLILWVYLAVILLCFITFRSWRAVLVAVIPLVITTVLCEALMVWLGIGLKVATLPVMALGVGIGVDYALYLLSVQLAHMRAGLPLAQAYRNALNFTGKVVALIGVTLSVAVVTWIWSPIKFQADMGWLLTFMFIWNMIGALALIPALSYFLLRRRLAGSDSRSPRAELLDSLAREEGKGPGRADPQRLARMPEIQ
ncbi:RND transporter [Pseudomonas citronellolis]|uniref:RND transporter n=1 Tax=Pseudomonas citronellolis TaxID=53408 RepID=A0A1A9KK51_9PSED|nr:MMPL family transporter [Pseudomonas citronellolis]ANI17500.1 RND transporter [Pseudomonas citronellolis]